MQLTDSFIRKYYDFYIFNFFVSIRLLIYIIPSQSILWLFSSVLKRRNF